jgi:chromosome segregation ATPase
MAKTARAAKARHGRAAADDSALALAATTAAGSILVNIAQAMDKASLRDEVELLDAQRAELVDVLGEWQAAHGDLRNRYERIVAELAGMRAEREAIEKETARQRVDSTRLRHEIVSLKAKLAELEGMLSAAGRRRGA